MLRQKLYFYSDHSTDRLSLFSRWIALILLGLAGVIFIAHPVSALEPTTALAKVNLVDKGGLCVVLEDSKLDFSLDLATKTKALIYVQIPLDQNLETARRKADTAGLLGRQLFIEQGKPTSIHLADNIADILFDLYPSSSVPMPEALRVLRPAGLALLESKEITKPIPTGTDDWSHPYHGPDNNPQSSDKIARAPYMTQFLAEPRYAPLPQVAVSSAGRLFKAYGHIAFKSREEALLNTLAAYNAYNGARLWKRKLTPGIMIHRNVFIATPTTLFVGDEESCKLLDTSTGALNTEIKLPAAEVGGTFWKWMAYQNGVLYALIGANEQRDPIVRQKRQGHGWPWNPLSPGFNQADNPWGFGSNLLAIEARTKKVLWRHQEEKLIDSRGLCMQGGNIYFFRFGAYLGKLDANTGQVVWRKTPANAPKLFRALGKDLNRQDWRTNWRTTAYLKCSDRALYFAGPMFDKLLAVSTANGTVLWQNSYNNYQLVLREDGLYGISGPWGNNFSRRFDPLTGRVLAEYDTGRRACARPTGSADAVFFRAMGGSVRLDSSSGQAQWISPMRAQCQDGVTIANGLLYWWPSVCDCQLSLYGITCLGPAGDFDFSAQATEAERLEKGPAYSERIPVYQDSQLDWPTLRATNTRLASTATVIPNNVEIKWKYSPQSSFSPTAPITVAKQMFFSGSDGIVRALNTRDGAEEWTSYTGGDVRISPSFWKGQLFTGSGDGWVYAMRASDGKLLWRFRAAPTERKIPVYNSLQSTWPAASGVLVDAGIAYVAAGIANYDGIYLYALDAKTGAIKWQNTSSGHLDADAHTGVSVQGHLLLRKGRLYLAGGTSISPAIYDILDGRCLNDPEQLKECSSIYPRGWELSQVGDHIIACGQPFYKHPDYQIHDPSATETIFHLPGITRDIIWLNNETVMCFRPIDKQQLNNCLAKPQRGYMIPAWGKFKINSDALWRQTCKDSVAMALCKNCVIVANSSVVRALRLADGQALWEQPLDTAPVAWGIAVNRAGYVIISQQDGTIICLGAAN
jgi:outer membrane protein assembly factor BamB